MLTTEYDILSPVVSQMILVSSDTVLLACIQICQFRPIQGFIYYRHPPPPRNKRLLIVKILCCTISIVLACLISRRTLHLSFVCCRYGIYCG